MKKLSFILILILLANIVFCQNVKTITGIITDINSNALPYAHVSLKNKSTGTVSNQTGKFVLKIIDFQFDDTLLFSYIGYSIKRLSVNEINKKYVTINLEKSPITIAEITVTPPKPTDIILTALEKISENYHPEPIALRSFYRESIKENDHFTEYAEGVIDIYKVPYKTNVKKQPGDQIKLIKGRRKNDLSGYEISDMTIVGIGGPVSCNKYDKAKYHPTFLRPESFNYYNYNLELPVLYDDKQAYVITFDMKDDVKKPLDKGTLYIEKESHTIVRIEYGLSPKGVKYELPGAVSNGILKLFKMSFKGFREETIIDYQKINDFWCLKSITYMDEMSVIRNKKLFVITVRKNLIVTDFKDQEVNPFTEEEILSSKEFKHQIGEYDEQFWGDFNYLLAPDEMVEAIKEKEHLP